MARKGAWRYAGACCAPCLPRCSLWPHRRNRARLRRTRRSPEAGPGRSIFEPLSPAGHRLLGRAGDPRPVRNHLFRRAAQGRDAGGMSATRRLAAILAADVAGYSRLIGADESGTLQALKAIRAELIDP